MVSNSVTEGYWLGWGIEALLRAAQIKGEEGKSKRDKLA